MTHNEEKNQSTETHQEWTDVRMNSQGHSSSLPHDQS